MLTLCVRHSTWSGMMFNREIPEDTTYGTYMVNLLHVFVYTVYPSMKADDGYTPLSAG